MIYVGVVHVVCSRHLYPSFVILNHAFVCHGWGMDVERKRFKHQTVTTRRRKRRDDDEDTDDNKDIVNDSKDEVEGRAE